MRYFLSKATPPFERLLLVESGSRSLFENLLPALYEQHPNARIDLVTCYAGLPGQYRADCGCVFRVTDYRDSAARKQFYSGLRANRYNVNITICSAEPIMTKWKWMLAARVPAKLLILNENGDYFWLDRGHLAQIRQFVSYRSGLSGAGAVRTLGRALAFPFALVYLVLYAATVHLRRKWRTL